MNAKEKISIRNHSYLEKLGFNWEISQPLEEESEPEEEKGDEMANEAEEEDEVGAEEEQGEQQQDKEFKPTFKESLFDENAMKDPIFQQRNKDCEAAWNAKYNELIGKYLIQSQALG